MHVRNDTGMTMGESRRRREWGKERDRFPARSGTGYCVRDDGKGRWRDCFTGTQ